MVCNGVGRGVVPGLYIYIYRGYIKLAESLIGTVATIDKRDVSNRNVCKRQNVKAANNIKKGLLVME